MHRSKRVNRNIIANLFELYGIVPDKWWMELTLARNVGIETSRDP
jgi:hypothetical protein